MLSRSLIALALLALAAPASAQDDAGLDAGLADAGPLDAGPVAVDAGPRQVSEETLAELEDTDALLESRLRTIYGEVQRFHDITVEANHGVVRLTGEVPTGEDGEQAAEIARGLDGVVFVNNRLTEPLAVADRLAPVRERMRGWGNAFIERLPLLGIGLLVLLLAWGLGKALDRANWLFGRVESPLMRLQVKRFVRAVLFLLAVFLALELLDATAVVGTLVGAAGVMGLAIGFAFKDIVENYLASFLLASRRPFSIGDAVKIGEHTGKVMRLTTRDTVLMTFDGNHLSLPNSDVFKATVLNYTRNPKRRFDFVVGAGTDADLLEAQKMGVQMVLDTPGVVADPPPFAQIEALGDSNVTIRFFGWVDQASADFFKVKGEAIRRVKTRLEDAGIDLPEPIYRVHMTQKAPPESTTKAKPITEADDAQVDVSPDTAIDEQLRKHKDEEENLLDNEKK